MQLQDEFVGDGVEDGLGLLVVTVIVVMVVVMVVIPG